MYIYITSSPTRSSQRISTAEATMPFFVDTKGWEKSHFFAGPERFRQDCRWGLGAVLFRRIRVAARADSGRHPRRQPITTKK